MYDQIVREATVLFPLLILHEISDGGGGGNLVEDLLSGKWRNHYKKIQLCFSA